MLAILISSVACSLRSVCFCVYDDNDDEFLLFHSVLSG